MSNKRKPAEPVTLAEAKTTRTLAALRQRVGATSDADAAAMAAAVASQMAALPASDKRLLRRDMAIAAHELEGLVQALEAELGLLASDLRDLNQRTGAARAYSQAATITHLRRP